MYIYIYMTRLTPQVYVNPLRKSRISQISGKSGGWDGALFWWIDRFVKSVQNLSCQTDLHLSRKNSLWTCFFEFKFNTAAMLQLRKSHCKAKTTHNYIYIYVRTNMVTLPWTIYIYIHLSDECQLQLWMVLFYYIYIYICVCVSYFVWTMQRIESLILVEGYCADYRRAVLSTFHMADCFFKAVLRDDLRTGS